MNLNFCHADAPSTEAASYISFGIASRPALRISVQNGSDFQMWTRIAIASAIDGSLSQFGPSRPVRREISGLTRPPSGLSMKRIGRAVGIDGTAQGRMKTNDSHLIQVRACTKKPDRSSAMIILRLMPTIKKISVLTTERANT